MADAKTKLIALLGHPVGHSLSPTIHNEAFRLLGLNYIYLAFDILPDKLTNAVDAIRTLPLRGVNLTMPLKEHVIPLLDELSPAARLSNSVNTIVNDDGHLTGHTTDGAGYIRSLSETGFHIKGKTMTLLGGGGAAKAILVQAAIDGAKKIYLFKRKNASFEALLQFANHIAEDTGCEIVLQDIADKGLMEAAISESALLTNATNVGMGEDRSTPVDASLLRKGILVSDIIYNPERTTLLKDAESIGADTIGGKDMLLYQAAASFKVWTGEDMPVKEIRNYINI